MCQKYLQLSESAFRYSGGFFGGSVHNTQLFRSHIHWKAAKIACVLSKFNHETYITLHKRPLEVDISGEPAVQPTGSSFETYSHICRIKTIFILPSLKTKERFRELTYIIALFFVMITQFNNNNNSWEANLIGSSQKQPVCCARRARSWEAAAFHWIKLLTGLPFLASLLLKAVVFSWFASKESKKHSNKFSRNTKSFLFYILDTIEKIETKKCSKNGCVLQWQW